MKWREATLLAVDVESTGLDPEQDRIIELGACLAVPGEELQPFRQLLFPGCGIPAEATTIHGITNEMVAGKPRIEDIAGRFLARVEAADVLVGYNWPFDEAFLRAELGAEWALVTHDKPVLDPLVLVRTPQVGKFWPGAAKGNPGRHRLENVAARKDIGIQRSGRGHRASSDAELTVKLLLHFGDSGTHYGAKLARHLPEDAYELSQLIAAWRVEQDKDFQAWRATQPESATV